MGTQVVYLDADTFLFSCPNEAFSHERFSLGETIRFLPLKQCRETARSENDDCCPNVRVV